MQTDVVITYVDSSDLQGQQDYELYKAENTTWTEEDRSKSYFRKNDLLRYVLRGIAKNLSGIRNVYLVVAYNSQVPDFVDKKTVNIITHDQIIPKEYLPTFNSCTIEMFLHKIPGLSEQYLYFNDDMFILNPMQENEFFTKDHKPISVMLYSHNLREQIGPGAKQVIHMYENLYQAGTYHYYKFPEHVVSAHTKSAGNFFGENNEQEIKQRITRFRADKNFNQYAAIYYGIVNNLVSEQLIIRHSVRFCLTERELGIIKFDFEHGPERKLICLNDQYSLEPSDDVILTVSKLLETKVGDVLCKYEI